MVETATSAISIDQVEDAWRYNLDTYAERVSDGDWLPYRWHVYLAQKLAEAVLAGRKRIIITAPPQHGKSTLAAEWLPAWYLDTFPTKRVILASYASPLAVSKSEKVRDLFDGTNPHTWARLNPNHSTKAEWLLKEGGGMKAVGVGSGITGFGGDLIIIDDPIKDWFEAQSTAALQKVIDWFNGTLYHRKTSRDTTFVLIQTRWNKRDLAGYLLTEHADDWVEIRLPALAEEEDAKRGIGPDPLGRAPGEALCSERFDEEDLQATKKAVGARIWAGLFQQRPAPVEGNIIKRDWIKYYGGPTGIELPEEGEQGQSWDLNAGEETAKGSHNVGQVWQAMWLIDQVRERWGYTETKAQLKKLSEKYPKARKKYVEKKAAGTPLINELKASVPGIIPVTPRGSKTARLESVAPYFEAGDVYFPHPAIAPWVPNLVEEVVTHPNADADDQVDTLSQWLNQCRTHTIRPMKLNLDVGVRSNPGELS